MRLPDNPFLNDKDLPAFVRQFYGLFRQIAGQVNQLSEGQMVAKYNALTAAPTTGTWAVGDYIANSAIAELGTAGSKYVIEGWRCTAAGTPGTWLQSRVLTGN